MTKSHSLTATLLNLGLILNKFEAHQKSTETLLEQMVKLSAAYSERVKEEEGRSMEEIEVMNVGKIDPKKHLELDVAELMASSILQCLGTMINTVVF